MIYGTPRDRNISASISRLLRALTRPARVRQYLCGGQIAARRSLADAVVACLDAPSPRCSRHATWLARIRSRSRNWSAWRLRAVGRRNVLLVPVPVQAAVAAAKVTRIVEPEQVRRLAPAAELRLRCSTTADFGFMPRSFRSRRGARGFGPRSGSAPAEDERIPGYNTILKCPTRSHVPSAMLEDSETNLAFWLAACADQFRCKACGRYLRPSGTSN